MKRWTSGAAFCLAFVGCIAGCSDEYSPENILSKKSDEFIHSSLDLNSKGFPSGIPDSNLKSKEFRDSFYNCLAVLKPDLAAANMPRLMKKFNTDRGALTPMELDVMSHVTNILDAKYKECAAQMRASISGNATGAGANEHGTGGTVATADDCKTKLGIFGIQTTAATECKFKLSEEVSNSPVVPPECRGVLSETEVNAAVAQGMVNATNAMSKTGHDAWCAGALNLYSNIFSQ